MKVLAVNADIKKRVRKIKQQPAMMITDEAESRMNEELLILVSGFSERNHETLCSVSIQQGSEAAGTGVMEVRPPRGRITAGVNCCGQQLIIHNYL